MQTALPDNRDNNPRDQAESGENQRSNDKGLSIKSLARSFANFRRRENCRWR